MIRRLLGHAAYNTLEPYRDWVSRYVQLSTRVQELSAVAAEQARELDALRDGISRHVQLSARLQEMSAVVDVHARELDALRARVALLDGIMQPDSPRVLVSRGERTWIVNPAEVEDFPFRDGDRLTIHPPERAAGLPNTWGDTHVEIRPGHAIRVPSEMRFFEYRGYRIPSHLISLTGAGPEDFDRIGRGHIDRFQQHVGIGPGMRVVDLGCGIGRDAFQLFDTLSRDGEYIGVDVTGDSIRWCRRHITERHPNFRFHHFDAVNELYNPYGTLVSSDFRLPVADSTVDRIVLSSVFTHLLEDEILHYLREFRRVLKPDGLTYASFFHLTPETLESAKTKHNTAWVPRFNIPLGNGLFANDPDYPRGAVGLTDEAARRLIGEAGLRLDRPFLKGWWSGHHGDAAEDGQDVMILRV